MTIKKHSVVGIYYTLKNMDGEVLGKTNDGEPLEYLHGANNIVPGLEEALEGKAQGESVSVDVKSEMAYGARVDALQQVVPKSAFGDIGDVEVGARFQAETENGPVPVVVIEVTPDSVTVDGNHPLAGQDLHFDVTVDSIRDASTEEIEHGHAHVPGEHQH